MTRLSRIALYSLVVAIGAALALLHAFGARPTHESPASESPWIPLPRSGMDAQSWELRTMLIRRTNDNADPTYGLSGASLPMRCGEYGNYKEAGQKLPDEYVATVGDYWSQDGARSWRVEFTVWGDDIEVRTIDRDAARPKLSIDQFRRRESPYPPGTESRFSRQQLAFLARAWQQPGLWHEAQAQGIPQCLDGWTIVLEACVAGRYAIRDRSCGADGETIKAFWQAIQKLPPPPKPGPAPAAATR